MKVVLKSEKKEERLNINAIGKVNAVGQLVLITMKNGDQFTGYEAFIEP